MDYNLAEDIDDDDDGDDDDDDDECEYLLLKFWIWELIW